jgi:hypothetical protein
MSAEEPATEEAGMEMKRMLGLAGLVLIATITVSPLMAQEAAQMATETKELRPEDKLVVLWTSDDRDVALKMVFMYTYNASTSRFGWWDDITLVVWGPSAKLLAEDKELQDYITKMKEAGITLEACKACADMYEVSDKLTELGIDVKYMGDVTTNYIKEGRHVLTF